MSARRMVLLLLGLAVFHAPGMPQTEPEPRFEVASVKLRNRENLFAKPRSLSRTLATFEGDYLIGLIQYAFAIPNYRVILPRGLRQVSYDISAVLPKGASVSDVPAMMRSLLVERFHLRSHWEGRMEDVFVLSTGGSPTRLKPTSADEPPMVHGDFVLGALELRRASMATVAGELTRCCSSRQVVDETNLTGKFDLTLTVGRDGFKALPLPPKDGEPQHVYDEGAWKSAIQKYGLEAKRERREVRYLVIDSVDATPTPN